MANTFLTPSIVAREALLLLKSTLTASMRVFRTYDSEFRRVGDTITIRKPPVFIARDADDDLADAGLVTQDVVETSTTITLDKWKYVRFSVGSKEKRLNLNQLSEQIIKPAILPIVEKVDSDILASYKSVPYFYGTAGTTPDSLADLAGVGKVLMTNKCPTDDLALFVDPAAQAALWPVMASMNAPKPDPINAALTRGQIGLVNNLNIYGHQSVASHTAGAGTVLIDNGAGYAAGTTAIHVDGVTSALVVGDLLTIGGNQHVVVTAGALSTADQDITIYPALKADVADNDPVTLTASHTANLAFHRNGIALVTAPLEMPEGGAKGEVLTDENTGLTLRAVYAWDNAAMADVITIDVLYGVKVVYPELCCRLLG